VLVSVTVSLLIRDMHTLPAPALKVILKEWKLKKYDPPNTDVREWIHTIENLSDTYGIPDIQRPKCAVRFVEAELRTELRKVLADPRATFGHGPVHWAQFKIFMTTLDRKWDLFIIEIRGIDNGKPTGNLRKRWDSGCPLSLTVGPRSRIPHYPTELPFYKKHPKATGAALGIAGAALLAPVSVVVSALTAVGFTSAGFAASSIPPLAKQIRY
jgi:hypothetical protein